MAAQLPSTALTRWLLQKAKANQRGFTLIELLVAIVVGSLILGSLLYIVVELMGTNAREERLTQAQQDTRRALDYISRDVREAVFVYADPTAVVAELTDEPTGTPVLAFWRLEPIDVGQLPACPGRADEAVCETLKVRQNVYNLVVYFHRDNSDNPLWSGPGRIIRYELTNYSRLANLTPTSGYNDPSITGNFASWVKGSGDTDGDAAVLADYIDNHDDGDPDVDCPNGLTAPPNANPTNSNNFFVCVRQGIVDGNNTNQSLHVFLRGSTTNLNSGTSVVFGPTSQASRLPTLNTEVQVRGVIGRQGPKTPSITPPAVTPPPP